jgi:hypothetical protein
VVVLVFGVASGLTLLVLQTRGPQSAAVFEVATGEAVRCPAGSGAPVCYRFDVTNTGQGPAPLRCAVAPAQENSAVFTASGTSLYRSDALVLPSDSYPLYTEVEAGEDEKDTIERPVVACEIAD